MTRYLKTNKVYIIDYAGNITGPYFNVAEAQEVSVETDTIIITVDPTYKRESKEQPKTTINKAVIDFNKNLLTIEGEGSLKDMKFGENDLTPFIKNWESLLNNLTRFCNDVTILGKPPVEGECLDEMLLL